MELRAPARKDSKMPSHKDKLEELANMSGLAEQAAANAAEAELDAVRERNDELDIDPFDTSSKENKAQRKDERRRDVIHTKPEDYDDQDESRPEPKEKEEADLEDDQDEDDDQIEDPIKLRKMLQKSRRAHRKIVKKLSKIEQGAALAMASTEKVKEAPTVTASPDALLTELGIEDPDAPLTGAELIKVMGKMNERQSQNLQAQDEQTRKVDKFTARAVASEKKMKQEVEDYDDVVNPYMGRLDPKNPNYDPGLMHFLTTRDDPARALYDLIVQATGRASPDDDGEDDLDEEEVDERTLEALRRRDKKQNTMTMSRTPESGRTKRRKPSRLTETLGVFEQIQNMDDKQLDQFTKRYGGEPY